MTGPFLYAPEPYWRLTPNARAEFRCGPGRGILEFLVPDTWRFPFIIYKPLVVQPGCSIHDYYYRFDPPSGYCTLDAWKIEADTVLRNNLVRITWHQHQSERDPRWLLMYRLCLCEVYYQKVHKYGGPAFWNERNKPTEIGLVATAH